MKNLTAFLILVLFSGGLYAQNITNTLPSNGNYIIKDATNVFFTLQQSTGHVGIGTSTFDATNPEQLKVDAGVTTSKNLISGYGTINSYLQLNVQNLSTGSSASSDLVATNNVGNESKGYLDMGINSSNYNDAAYNIGGKNDSYIYCMGNTGGSPVGGNLSIGTGSTSAVIKFHTGGTTSSYERMRIDGSGNVGIGTTNSGYKFQVKIDGSNEGHVTSTGVWANSSDIRLKKNIKSIENSLGYIMNLNPVRFDMNNEGDSKTGNHFGFIAQEMEIYLPELVGTDAEGMKSIEYATLTSILAGAVKEQQNEIIELKERLTALEKKSPATQNAGIGGSENSNMGMWIFLSVVVLSGAGFMMRRNKQ